MVKCTIQQRSLLSCWSALIVHVSLNSIGENIKPKSGRYQKGRKDPLGRVGRTQDSPWGLMLCYLLTVAWLESWKFPACSYCEQDAPLRPDIASLEVFCPLRFLEVGQMLQEYTDQSLRKAPTQPWRSPETAAYSCFFRITSVFEARSHSTWTSSAKVRTINGSWKGIFLPTWFLASGWGKWRWEGQAISTFSPTSGWSPQWDSF